MGLGAEPGLQDVSGRVDDPFTLNSSTMLPLGTFGANPGAVD